MYSERKRKSLPSESKTPVVREKRKSLDADKDKIYEAKQVKKNTYCQKFNRGNIKY